MRQQTAKKLPPISISKILIDGDKITANLSDGRIVSIPIAWFPRLSNARLQQLQNFQISPSGYGVHWPEIDEDISIKVFIS
ncbi:MAG: DUF2442 domain-containing protein [Bdellovibrionales bacterium]